MSNVGLLFEGGIPASVQRIIKPDSIMRLVNKKAQELGGVWSKTLSRRANAIMRGDRPWWKIWEGSSDLYDSGTIRDYLYFTNPNGWPLTPQEVELLKLLMAVRDMSYQESPSSYLMKKAPSERQIKSALKRMAKDAHTDILLPMWNDLNKAAYAVGPYIEEHCVKIYGEPCTSGEGAEMFAHDLKTAVRIGRLDVSYETSRVMDIMVPLWK